MSKDAPTAHSYSHLGFVSTSRADAGIYLPILQSLAERRDRALTLFAGGTHLSQRFGHTIEQLTPIDGVGVTIVEHHVDGDRPGDVAAGVGRAVEAFARAFEKHRPDLIFALGDRPEMLTAALAATICRIPIAHLHGGESTTGAYDDACRHALTKLAHVHFTAAPQYRDRVIAMNESPARVHVVGAPALDRLFDFTPESPAEMVSDIGLNFAEPTLIVAFHVETLSPRGPAAQIAALLGALAAFDVNMLFIGGNADVGHAAIEDAIRRFVVARPRARLVASLPQDRFWSGLAHARALVGNSSAGIIEAASFELPAVNVGDRQGGRLRAANVIDVSLDEQSIRDGIEKALSSPFRESLRHLENPYGDGHAAERIAMILDSLPPPAELLRKPN